MEGLLYELNLVRVILMVVAVELAVLVLWAGANSLRRAK